MESPLSSGACQHPDIPDKKPDDSEKISHLGSHPETRETGMISSEEALSQKEKARKGNSSQLRKLSSFLEKIRIQ